MVPPSGFDGHITFECLAQRCSVTDQTDRRERFFLNTLQARPVDGNEEEG